MGWVDGLLALAATVISKLYLNNDTDTRSEQAARYHKRGTENTYCRQSSHDMYGRQMMLGQQASHQNYRSENNQRDLIIRDQYEQPRSFRPTGKDPVPSSTRSEKQKVSRHRDYKTTIIKDTISSKKERGDIVLQRRRTYEEGGVLRKKCVDSKGKEVMKEEKYIIRRYEEVQLTPSQAKRSKGSSHDLETVSKDRKRR